MKPRWASPAEYAEIARFFAANIARDNTYISHGEIQTGLSVDGARWSADLERLMQEDFADPGPDRLVAVIEQDGMLAGAMVVLFTRTERVSYLTIEDLVVSPEARSAGLGASLVEFAEAEGRLCGMAWAFLESGLHNDRAHRFFDRQGFRAMSKVFARPLK